MIILQEGGYVSKPFVSLASGSSTRLYSGVMSEVVISTKSSAEMTWIMAARNCRANFLPTFFALMPY